MVLNFHPWARSVRLVMQKHLQCHALSSLLFLVEMLLICLSQCIVFFFNFIEGGVGNLPFKKKKNRKFKTPEMGEKKSVHKNRA